MKMRMMMVGAALAVAAGIGTAQAASVDRSFTATGENCMQVNWSQETLAKHPKIAAACKAVLQRNGKFYVKFDAEVKKVADAGRQVTVDVDRGSTLTLTPREGATVLIDGKKTPVSKLRPGDQLTFYIPEDRFTTTMTVETPTPAEEVPIIEPPAPVEQVAMTTTDYSAMPHTASPLPLLGLAGLLLLAAGAGLTIRRRARGL